MVLLLVKISMHGMVYCAFVFLISSFACSNRKHRRDLSYGAYASFDGDEEEMHIASLQIR